MSATKQTQAQARDLKQRVLTCLHKLSDRDTHTAAASELESIAKSLTSDSLPPFLTSISATDSSDKSPVRRHCLKLISILSENHKNSLSPHLSKLLFAVSRRLRDPDSSVRSACVSASFSIAEHLTSPPFTSIAKPFLESLFTEQDSNAQTGAALCLAAVIEGSIDPDVASLRKLLPKIEKLVKCESFKAKPAVLGLIGSVVGVKGVLSGRGNAIKNLVVCLVEFLSSEDWAARKAAAEALIKIAVVEKFALSEFKVSCLKTFEAKRFDKVKSTRETMNQMIDAWKEIPDQSDESTPPPPPAESQASSKSKGTENASDGRYPSGPRTSSVGCAPSRTRTRIFPLHNQTSKTPFDDGSPASMAKKSTPVGSSENNKSRAMFRKLDHKKPTNRNFEITAAPTDSENSKDCPLVEQEQFTRPGIRRSLFNGNYENPTIGLVRNGSRIVPLETEEICRNQQDCEDLSLIRKQLVQIENQQSNLFDLLQKFIGSSQNGMQALEARVRGLELALDEISFDLAVSTGRMSSNTTIGGGGMCCKIPGTDFINSKFWRKTESRSSTSRLPAPSSTGTSVVPQSNNGDFVSDNNQRYRFQGNRGIIKNPLALSEISSNGVSIKAGI